MWDVKECMYFDIMKCEKEVWFIILMWANNINELELKTTSFFTVLKMPDKFGREKRSKNPQIY